MSTLASRITHLLALIAWLSPSLADAHRFEHPKTLRIGVEDQRLLISALYDLNPGEESLQIRSLFDRDTSGALETAEQEKLAEWLATTAMSFFELEIGAPGQTKPVALSRLERTAHRTKDPTDSSSNLGVTLLFAVTLPAGSSELEIVIRDRDKDASRHVPLIADVPGAFVIAFASQGEWHPRTRQLHRVSLKARAPLTLRIRRFDPARSKTGSKLGP